MVGSGTGSPPDERVTADWISISGIGVGVGLTFSFPCVCSKLVSASLDAKTLEACVLEIVTAEGFQGQSPHTLNPSIMVSALPSAVSNAGWATLISLYLSIFSPEW